MTLLRNGKVVESFALEPGTGADHILEKLTGGRKMEPGTRSRPASAGEELISIAGVQDAHGELQELTIGRSEIVAIYGVVGCGNVEIAHALAGVAPARGYTIRLKGQPFRPRTPYAASRGGVTYLASKRSEGVLGVRSVRENVLLSTLASVSRGGLISHAAERDRAEELLRAYAVKYDSLESSILSLSGGNQQKVLIARALTAAEIAVVLEEPTAGVDVAAKHTIHELLRRRRTEGLGVLLISSDLAEVISLADHVYTMYAGRIINQYRQTDQNTQVSIISDILGHSRMAGEPK